MLMDNCPPWGSDLIHTHTSLTIWLIRLSVGVSHGRPYHPLTQGKDERFHRTFQAEVLHGHSFSDPAYCQRRFSSWRDVYNLERPHQALNFATPATRYQISVAASHTVRARRSRASPTGSWCYLVPGQALSGGQSLQVYACRSQGHSRQTASGPLPLRSAHVSTSAKGAASISPRVRLLSYVSAVAHRA